MPSLNTLVERFECPRRMFSIGYSSRMLWSDALLECLRRMLRRPKSFEWSALRSWKLTRKLESRSRTRLQSEALFNGRFSASTPADSFVKMPKELHYLNYHLTLGFLAWDSLPGIPCLSDSGGRTLALPIALLHWSCSTGSRKPRNRLKQEHDCNLRLSNLLTLII